MAGAEPEAGLTTEQKNAIAMLNYITVLTKDINASKNSRLCMEEAYVGLINNTYPNAVDARTLSQLTALLDTMEQYRMISAKRERLHYVYEQNQAKAVRTVIPSATKFLKNVDLHRPDTLVSAVAYMAVDAISSYTSKEEDLKYLKDGWALDDEEAAVLHESRKGTFSYMVKMVNDYSLPGDLTLTEEMVDEFVHWKNEPNLIGRIQFLESNRKTYQSYGGYWLLLADSYYQDGQFDKCLDAVSTYEDLGIRVFRRDYELAKVLPLAIASAEATYGLADYRSYAAEHARMLVENTRHDDWALRYYAALTYADLYARTKEKAYLQSCYEIALDSVNYLMATQKTMNAQYLTQVQEEAVPKGTGKKEKKEIENYNKFLKTARKT